MHTIRTLVVESPDQTLIRATVRKLGLEGRANMNVARGLKWLVDFGPRRFAVIDIGTNSVKYHLGERDTGRRIPHGRRPERGDTARRRARRVGTAVAAGDRAHGRRGRGDDRRGAARRRARRSRRWGPAGLRIASNRDAFIDRGPGAAAAVIVEVISGEDEGATRVPRRDVVTSRSATAGSWCSTPAAAARSSRSAACGEPEERFSVDVGAAKYTDRFGLDGAVSPEVLDGSARRDRGRPLLASTIRPRTDAVIGMGGTSTNLAAIHLGLAQYDPDAVHGTRIVDLASSTVRSSCSAPVP